MSVLDRLRRKDPPREVRAQQLHTAAAAPTENHDGPPAERPDWFLNTNVFEIPDDYNKADNERLFRYIGETTPETKELRADYFDKVRGAVRVVSDRSFDYLPDEARMTMVLVAIEALLQKRMWSVNADLRRGIGNVAVNTGEKGYWNRTQRVLARAIVLVYQQALGSERKAAA